MSCVSKIFFKIVSKQIYNHLYINKLLYKFQSGFLPGYSTTHQLIELYDNNLLALDKKQITSITFADISKAFDTVWSKALILKLVNYGIKGKLLFWLKSYLSIRKQRVVIKDAISSTGELKAGVPQGSVLRPLLFLIFINDVADNMTGFGRLFADDTCIGHMAHNEENLHTLISTDLEYLNAWSYRWLVKFNPNKTDIMIFSTRHLENNLLFDFNNISLSPVHMHKHLGVIFSNDCKWTKHIDVLIERTSKQLNILRKLKYRLKRDYLEKIYLVFIRPILEYASEIWDNYGQTNCNHLEKIQVEAARIVTGLSIYASFDSIYKETWWETLSTRRKVKKNLLLFYKIVNKEAPDYLYELVPPLVAANVNYNLRNRHNIHVPFNRLTVYQNSYFPCTIQAWNSLDLTIRNLPTFSSFKLKLQQIFYTKRRNPQYYYIGDRFLSVLHSRMRNKCSALNAD